MHTTEAQSHRGMRGIVGVSPMEAPRHGDLRTAKSCKDPLRKDRDDHRIAQGGVDSASPCLRVRCIGQVLMFRSP